MRETYAYGTLGVTSTWGSVAFATLSHAYAGLQVLSVIIGLIIGCWTLYRMWKYPPKNDKDDE